jgi:hypothetical protein
MISGKYLLPRTILLALLLASTAASGRSLDELERALKRTPPVKTAFVEFRFSHLLKKPLRSSGTLEYRADGVMARIVELPNRETTEVIGDQVRIARAGRSPRTMSLQRAPQMRVLLGSFRALLEGRLTPLQQDFNVALDDGGAQWTLTLKPKDAALAKHLARIEVHGNGDQPACVEALEPDGDGALTLFAAGGVPLTGATASATPARTEIEKLCRAPASVPGAAVEQK